ncbi:hypothetical protein M7I_0647 [Glarea lozoyensis 74030]|uniref:Class I glutamine amidotransferase-like protein n=1 Tax=Glarea lozoyensis (strain ATCC 74030 / MF5533) TaxID=1104152 RepID=H0EDJ8_GLAL7|nr:hypothetical protein M7I_0647 [Glarea lozoyensis 74030]
MQRFVLPRASSTFANLILQIGVYPVTLTPNGQTFFTTSLPSETHYNIHQFHEREVKTRGKGFIALAENNQCFVNAANTILTLQGHPEMSVELSKMLLEDVPKYLDVEEVERKALEDRVEREHDGMAIWKRIAGEVANAAAKRARLGGTALDSLVHCLAALLG